MTGNDEPPAAQVGALLRALRRRYDIMQGELARLASSSTSVISRLERGQRLPDGNTIRRLDEALGSGGALEAKWLATLDDAAEPVRSPATRWVHNYPAAYHGII